MSLTDKQTRERIRDLNDAFRKTLDPTLGRVMLTAGVNALPSDVRAMAIRRGRDVRRLRRRQRPAWRARFRQLRACGAQVLFQNRLLRSPSRVRFGRSRRPGEDDPRPHAHARRGVLSHARQSLPHLRPRKLDCRKEAPRAEPSGLKAPRFQSCILAFRPTSRVYDSLSRTAIRLMTFWNAESGGNLRSQSNQS